MQDFSTISICLSADERYIWHLFDTLWSIRKVSQTRRTDVYVLLDCLSLPSYYEISTEILRLSTTTLNIIPINVNKAIDADKSRISTTSAITFSSYARIFLPEIFPNMSKILWLDCDLIVMKPLDEFWDIDVTGKYAAAVDDFTMEHSIHQELVECRVSRYFNAGVMLFNLDEIKKDGVNEKCKEVMYGTKPRFQDQTVLNSCFKENVIWLSPRFNLHYTSYSNPAFEKWAMSTFHERYKSEMEDPTIVHFTGIGTKPWQKPTPFYLNEYWDNASEARSFILTSAPTMFKRVIMDMRRYECPSFSSVKSPTYIPHMKERKIHVCITSYPPRIKGVADVVKNMVEQTIKPDTIFLTLSKLEFQNETESLPEELVELIDDGTLAVNWTDDNTKTMKKVFPVLDKMEPDDLIVIIDDDITFPNDFIERRLNDFYKFGQKFGISSNHDCEAEVSCVVSGAGSMMERRMLDGYERFLTKDVVSTFEDDWAYMFIMRLNGYRFIACSDYPKTRYDYKKLAPSKCYNTKKTIKVMTDRSVELEKDWH